ncbi:hypothetical protein HQ545_03315 [Candidatus Woesearchaeota archaeon]|nr:hypothetical protein [Candidatus Woesearchaeota archaeon]
MYENDENCILPYEETGHKADAVFSPPKTMLDDIVSYYMSVKKEEHQVFTRIDQGVQPAIAYRELNTARMRIDLQYCMKLDVQDHYSFDDIDSLETFLTCTQLFSSTEIEKSITHELAHAEAAVDEGLQLAGFDCWLCNDGENIEYVISTKAYAHNMPGYDAYKRICSAPDVPSMIDCYV